jgi:hypothetical protein
MSLPHVQTYDASAVFAVVSFKAEPWEAPEPYIPVCPTCSFPFHEDLCVHCFTDAYGLYDEGQFI